MLSVSLSCFIFWTGSVLAVQAEVSAIAQRCFVELARLGSTLDQLRFSTKVEEIILAGAESAVRTRNELKLEGVNLSLRVHHGFPVLFIEGKGSHELNVTAKYLNDRLGGLKFASSPAYFFIQPYSGGGYANKLGQPSHEADTDYSWIESSFPDHSIVFNPQFTDRLKPKGRIMIEELAHARLGLAIRRGRPPLITGHSIASQRETPIDELVATEEVFIATQTLVLARDRLVTMGVHSFPGLSMDRDFVLIDFVTTPNEAARLLYLEAKRGKREAEQSIQALMRVRKALKKGTPLLTMKKHPNFWIGSNINNHSSYFLPMNGAEGKSKRGQRREFRNHAGYLLTLVLDQRDFFTYVRNTLEKMDSNSKERGSFSTFLRKVSDKAKKRLLYSDLLGPKE